MAEGARMIFSHSGQLRPLGGAHFPLPTAANERGGDLCDLGGDLSGKKGPPSGPHLDLATRAATQQEAGSHAAAAACRAAAAAACRAAGAACRAAEAACRAAEVACDAAEAAAGKFSMVRNVPPRRGKLYYSFN